MKKEEAKEILDIYSEFDLLDEETKQEIENDIDNYLEERVKKNAGIIERLKEERIALGLPFTVTRQEVNLFFA